MPIRSDAWLSVEIYIGLPLRDVLHLPHGLAKRIAPFTQIVASSENITS